jgi:hypothetical protein
MFGTRTRRLTPQLATAHSAVTLRSHKGAHVWPRCSKAHRASGAAPPHSPAALRESPCCRPTPVRRVKNVRRSCAGLAGLLRAWRARTWARISWNRAASGSCFTSPSTISRAPSKSLSAYFRAAPASSCTQPGVKWNNWRLCTVRSSKLWQVSFCKAVHTLSQLQRYAPPLPPVRLSPQHALVAWE